jgi:hypothetical protein
MKNERLLVWLTLSAALLSSVRGSALESRDPALLGLGGVRGVAAGGVSFIDRHSNFNEEISLRVGLGTRLEIAAPLALCVLVLDAGDKGGVTFGIGVPDLFVNSEGRLLYSPTAVVGGKVRIGREASLWAAFDFTGAEQGIQRKDHALWMRGSLSLAIDFGRFATIAFGASYQRMVVDGLHPEGLEKAGWAADARISFGGVRAQPFTELPVLSIHLQRYLDLITMVRVDIDLHTATSNTLWLTGIELRH